MCSCMFVLGSKHEAVKHIDDGVDVLVGVCSRQQTWGCAWVHGAASSSACVSETLLWIRCRRHHTLYVHVTVAPSAHRLTVDSTPSFMSLDTSEIGRRQVSLYQACVITWLIHSWITSETYYDSANMLSSFSNKNDNLYYVASLRWLPITLISLCLVSHFNSLFILCCGLSWLPTSFLLYVKYTLSYYGMPVACPPVWIFLQNCNSFDWMFS